MTKEAKNPFPKKGVVALSGNLEQKLRTFPTKELNQAAEFANEYIDNALGQIITISGSSGSGKTHLIHFMMDTVRKRSSSPENSIKQLYVKVENADFASLYKEIVSQIGYDLLRELNSRFLGYIAFEKLKEQNKEKESLLSFIPNARQNDLRSIAEEATLNAERHFDNNPATVYKYLDNLILQPEMILDKRAEELNSIAGENFKKSFYYLDNTDLGKIAYKWFVMDSMTETELRQIGVSSPLNTSDEARSALRLLVTLFQYSKIQLLLYIDQIEKLLPDTDSRISGINAGYLQSLAEFFPREKGFLVLSGIEEGWKFFKKDFWQRVGSTEIILQQISVEESYELIKVYLDEEDGDLSGSDETKISPFTTQAVREILRLSGGNKRRFLQNCHNVYQKYLDNEINAIDAEQVKTALAEEDFDKQSVENEIRAILKQKNIKFGDKIEGNISYKPDFVIGEPRDPVAVIQVSDAMFYLEETQNAINLTNFKTQLVGSFPKTKLITVVMGYISNDVLTKLQTIVDYCLVYEIDEFKSELASILDSIHAAVPPPVNAQETEQIKLVINSVKESLAELFASREEELKRLSTRIEKLVINQSFERVAPSPQRLEWQIWLRDDQDRWENRQIELKQRAREDALRLYEQGETLESKRQQTNRIIVGVASVIVTFFVYISYSLFISSFSFRNESQYDLINTLRLPVSLLGGVVIVFYIFILSGKYALIRNLISRETIEFSGDLNQISLRARTSQMHPSRIKRYLDSFNPIEKYLGVQILLTRKGENFKNIEIDWLAKALSETWKPLYVAYFNLAVKTAQPEDIVEHIKLLLETDANDPRLIYAISLLAKTKSVKNSDIIESHFYFNKNAVPIAHGIFEELFEAVFYRGSSIDSDMHPLTEFAISYRTTLNGKPFHSRMESVVNEYLAEGNLSQRFMEEIPELAISKNEIHQIVNALSPHRESGLASFYDLSISNFYLRLYRFFAELEWHAERSEIYLKD